VTLEKNEDPINADVLTTSVAHGIAVINLGSTKRIYFDQEMGDALTEALDEFAGDAKVRVVVVTGSSDGHQTVTKTGRDRHPFDARDALE
jgi:hypothetical protein